MQELVLKLKNNKSLNALLEFAEKFDIEVERKVPGQKKVGVKRHTHIPVSFAAKPDVTALAGIWKGRTVSIDDLRNEAWGERL